MAYIHNTPKQEERFGASQVSVFTREDIYMMSLHCRDIAESTVVEHIVYGNAALFDKDIVRIRLYQFLLH